MSDSNQNQNKNGNGNGASIQELVKKTLEALAKDQNMKEAKEMIQKILVQLARLDERLKNLIDSNDVDHTALEKEIDKSCTQTEDLEKRIETLEKEGAQILQDKIKELQKKVDSQEDRIQTLEKEGVKLNVFWKVLIVVGPALVSGVVTILIAYFFGIRF
jgi:DNA repair ATPase RecN